ncbi:hypothetical protein MGN01_34440 [Methylobacterium gnaphalii]|uniref:FAD/NAD(P)-binding domain-containing protein n=2 Tax=Methylobacterium gnaphalii TaxID=1010610 RepID=A0A512JNS3_9HYPH|nr:hypothetical protein MGN01_34440 [Methylobacterium gnaphalii]GLS49138.1 hypothetical protein GCM10007885_19860 [Methylobacterium gnaphalii]
MVVERSRLLGCGKLSEYRIPSNTLADVILECVCDNLLPEGMARLRQQSPTVAQLEAMKGLAPDLDLVSDCLSDAAEMLVCDLSQHHRIAVQREHLVETLIVRDDGTFDIEVRKPSGSPTTARVASVVLNLGGVQKAETIGSLGSLFQCDLPDTMPIMASDSILQQSDAGLVARFAPLIGKKRTIVVAGSSHSAFSVVERLARVADRLGLSRIIIAHRTPPRFYYRDLMEAEARGDVVDAVEDVCPLSGRVNRLGGLRFRTAEVARAVFGTNRLDAYPVEIETRHVIAGCSETSLAEDMPDVGAIVTCFGYRPLLPIIRDQTGEILQLAEDRHGLTTDDFGRPMRQNGRVIRGLFSFGLGSGMRIGSEVGGEPSYKRRLDGIWLYHNHVGSKVTAGLIEDLRHFDLAERQELELCAS